MPTNGGMGAGYLLGLLEPLPFNATTMFDEKAGLLEFSGPGYTWGQTNTDIQVRIPVPDGTRAKMLSYKLTATSIHFGLPSQEPLLSGSLCHACQPDDSTWTLEDNEIYLVLLKSKAMEFWDCVVKNHPSLNPQESEDAQKKMMLERYQNEHPGFDFSGANFSGGLPANWQTHGLDLNPK